MRDLNAAASQSQMRLARVGSDGDAVRFRVVPPDKREVAISDDAKQARVAKAKATREAHRAERDQMPAADADMNPGQDGATAAGGAVQEATPQRTRRPRRAAG